MTMPVRDRGDHPPQFFPIECQIPREILDNERNACFSSETFGS